MREWTEPTTVYEDAQPPAARRLDLQVRLLYRAGVYAGAIGAVLAATLGMLASVSQGNSVAIWVGAIFFAVVLTAGIWFFLKINPPVKPLSCHLWRIAYALITAVSSVSWGMLAAPEVTAWPEMPANLVGLLALLGLISTLVVASFWPPLGVIALLLFSGTVWRELGFPALDNWSGPGGLLSLCSGLLLVAVLWASALSRWLLQTQADENSKSDIIVEMQHDLVEQERQIKVESDHRNRVERELTLAHDAAEGAIRAKTEFLATMSHEIRTPLNGILPILELLLDTPLSTDQREYVDTAHKSSRHLLRLINDVLDFAKVEAGKLELEYIEIKLDELVESVTDLMRRTAERKGLELQVLIDKEAPEAVRGDPIRLRQVLTNLVSNAVKFTDSGSVRVEIKQLRVGRKEVNLRFSVIDTGIGMSAGTAKRLFQSFTQADASTTRKHGGTGLGLVICRRLVELMGGEIGVHSTPDKGSTFWFELPMRRSKHDVPPARRDLSDVRVLTVIKDPHERAQVSTWLDAWQVMEERAESAIAAISKLKTSAMLGESWAFELVLADTRSQEQAVTTIVREIRSEAELSALPVVVAGPGIEATLFEHPNLVSIDVPIQKQELRRVLVRLLDVEELGVAPYDPAVDAKPMFEAYADEPPANISTREHAASGQLSGRVLLVEDNPVNSAVARKLLQHIGVDCVIAEDGIAALVCVEAEQFDVILMDVQMPNMDGFEATEKIRERESLNRLNRVPIVAITANAMRGDKEKCLAGGMDDYLSKPLDMEILKNVLARWLSTSARTSVDDEGKPHGFAPPVKHSDQTQPQTDIDRRLSNPVAATDAVESEYGDNPLDDELITNIGKIADSAVSSWDSAEDSGSSDLRQAINGVPVDSASDVEHGKRQVGESNNEWNTDIDEFLELDSELVRDLAEDNWDDNIDRASASESSLTTTFTQTEANNTSGVVGELTEELFASSELDREWVPTGEPKVSAADVSEVEKLLESESMPTDLDWLASHEQEVESIEITTIGANSGLDAERKANLSSISIDNESGGIAMSSSTQLLEIDATILRDLREVMEDDFQSVLVSYLENAPLQLDMLEDAAKAGDIDTMIRPAHSLKSSSANVGAMRVSELAKEIETNARDRQRTAAVAALPELREAFDSASTELAGIASR